MKEKFYIVVLSIIIFALVVKINSMQLEINKLTSISTENYIENSLVDNSIEDTKKPIVHDVNTTYRTSNNVSNNVIVDVENTTVENTIVENTVTENTVEDNTEKEDEIIVQKIDEIHTSYTLDFTGINEDGEFVYGEDQPYYGWEESLWGGCSSWCSVADFERNEIASSTLMPHGRFSYSVSNISNFDRSTSWVEGVEGNGIGEYIEIEQMCLVASEEYKTDIKFTEICIVNGYAATEKNWIENNRVKSLKMYFNDKYVTTLVLEDTIKQQYLDISALGLKVKNGETAKFRFEISDVYNGTKYDDTCLTGLLIEFSGRTGH